MSTHKQPTHIYARKASMHASSPWAPFEIATFLSSMTIVGRSSPKIPRRYTPAGTQSSRGSGGAARGVMPAPESPATGLPARPTAPRRLASLLAAAPPAKLGA